MEQADLIWSQYQKGLSYIKSTGLDDEWIECEKFWEGEQWPKATDRTKSFPRPVVNVCSMIADNKKSGILSEKIKIIYRPDEMFGDMLERANHGANIFTKFCENVQQELEQENLDDEAVENLVKLGTAIYHYYWDNDVSGGMTTPYLGGMRGEILHPKNVIVSNFREKDIQKQKYIIIASVESLSSVKELAKKNGVKNYDQIKADNEIDDEATKVLETCTVLTRYTRKNNKVVWSKSTQNVMIQEPTYWEPGLNEVKLDEEDYKNDGSEIKEPDKAEQKEIFNRKQLYPIELQSYKNRKDCIYGIGEVKQCIANNKAINFNLAMMLLSVQQTAWPKIIQKAGALARQVITNAPGEIITDNSKTQGWGIQYLNTPAFNAQALTLTDNILNLTRSTTGATEVVTGEVLGANMAASAIIALQNQAKKPIETAQKKFFRSHIRIGRIIEQFFKCYYTDDRLFSYEEDQQTYTSQMNGSNYSDIDFSTNIEVGARGVFSESLIISLLDQLLQQQAIDVDDYIELYPDSIMTFKETLKKMRAKKLEVQQMKELLINQQMLNQPQMQQTIENVAQPV